MSDWVNFFVNQGLQWPDYSGRVGREIRLISMPCQSHGAALASLGAVVRDLGDLEANDRSRHIEGLMKYAEQYLNFCKDCNLTVCNPAFKRCGFKSKATGRIFKAKTNTRYLIHPESKPHLGELKLLLKSVPVAITDKEYIYHQCYPEGGVALEDGLKGSKIDGDAYDFILPSKHLDNPNLSTAYSGLCYAGSPRFGAAETKRFNSNFKLLSNTEISLGDLLPIYGWGSQKVPRLVFVNTRGMVTFSHVPVSPRLVIADGVDAFLKCVDHPALAGANILAIVRRDGRRDSDETLSDKLKSLLQWYDRRLVDVSAPAGVSVIDYTLIA